MLAALGKAVGCLCEQRPKCPVHGPACPLETTDCTIKANVEWQQNILISSRAMYLLFWGGQSLFTVSTPIPASLLACCSVCHVPFLMYSHLEQDFLPAFLSNRPAFECQRTQTGLWISCPYPHFPCGSPCRIQGYMLVPMLNPNFNSMANYDTRLVCRRLP